MGLWILSSHERLHLPTIIEDELSRAPLFVICIVFLINPLRLSNRIDQHALPDAPRKGSPDSYEIRQANSHAKCGWQRFTDEVIKALNERHEGAAGDIQSGQLRRHSWDLCFVRISGLLFSNF